MWLDQPNKVLTAACVALIVGGVVIAVGLTSLNAIFG